MAVLVKQRMPRHLYYRKIANSIISGKGIYDVLSSLDRDGVEYWFDDFQGTAAALDGQYTPIATGGTVSTAASTAILAAGTGDANDHYGFTGGSINWFGNRNCLFQCRAKISSAALTNTKFEMGWHGAVAGSVGLLNDLDAATVCSWVGTTAGICFVYDSTSATDDVWQAAAYNSANPKKRVLYDSGTASAITSTTLTQADHTWVVNSFTGQTVWAGTAHAKIKSNSTTVLTLERWFPATPAATATYIISTLQNATASDALTVPHLDRYNTYTIAIEDTVALFYIDGVQVAEIPAAVTKTVGLTPWLYAQTRDGTENALLAVDYLLCMQSREA